MRAIILAAGKGSRLRGVAGDKPKCLAMVGELTLVERQISALRAAGIDDIIAVVGFGAESVRRVCGPEIEYIENPVFFRTSSLYSLWLTRHRLGEGFVVLNSDVLFHPQLLTDLVTARYEDALLISYTNSTTPALGAEEMKVKVRAGRVVDISKAMEPGEADGENVGIVRFGAAGAALLGRQMEQLILKGANRAWAPRAFLEFARVRDLHAIGTRGLPWIEIDFPEDYYRAINDVLPGIEEAEPIFVQAPMRATVAVGEGA
jgi:L-glutamine-phosphate cytidylyltransferase